MGWLDWSFGEDEKKYNRYVKIIQDSLNWDDPAFADSVVDEKTAAGMVVGNLKSLISDSFFDSNSVFKRDKYGENLLISEVALSLSKRGYHKLSLEAIDLIYDSTIKLTTASSLDPATLEYANKNLGKDDK